MGYRGFCSVCFGSCLWICTWNVFLIFLPLLLFLGDLRLVFLPGFLEAEGGVVRRDSGESYDVDDIDILPLLLLRLGNCDEAFFSRSVLYSHSEHSYRTLGGTKKPADNPRCPSLLRSIQRLLDVNETPYNLDHTFTRTSLYRIALAFGLWQLCFAR